MRCDDLKDLVPLHLTGLLDREEEAGLGEHLAAAVTDESAGGSPQPTGSILLLGKV